MNCDKELLNLYDKLIKSVIKNYCYYFDYEDLYQVGFMGLTKAYKNYKKDKGCKFSSYAYFYIEGEVKEYVRVNSTFKYSKDFIRLKTSYDKAKSLLSQKLGKIPNSFEIANFLEVEEEKIKEIEASYNNIESLDNDSFDDCNLYNFIGFHENAYKEENIDLKNEIEKLEEPEKTIIKSRFLEGFTQSEISTILGISQVQISRKEKTALQRLRARLK